MVTYREYLKSVMTQIYETYRELDEMTDKPGDLDMINKSLLKINGMLKVIITKIEPKDIQLSNFVKIQNKMSHYIDSYFFEKEIETMGPLYANDTNRIKNMRLKILEALEGKKMMEEIRDMIEEL